MSLVTVGSVAYDSVETAHGRRDDMLGGSATYFSVASALFSPPSLVAVVGEDFRTSDVALLASRGVDLTGLQRAPGRTFRWGGRYHDDLKGRDTLFTELNVFEHFQPDLPAAYRAATHVFLGNIHPSLQARVLDQVEAPEFVALDTMNFWIEGEGAALRAVLGRIDALFINDEEASLLTGHHSMVAAAAAIRDLGPSLVIIKRGEHGAMLFDAAGVFYAPAVPLSTVIDPTGAGDTFAGGFMGYLYGCGGVDPVRLRQATVVGTLLASFCVEGFSLDRLTEVTLGQLRDRYDAYAAMTSCPAPSL